MGRLRKIFSKPVVVLPLFLFSLIVLLLVINLVQTVQEYRRKAAKGEWISPKKGLGGPLTSETAEQARISWYYNWTPLPLNNQWISSEKAKFVSHFTSRMFNWCQTDGDLATIDSQVQAVCRQDYCNKGNYYLIGNEPFVRDQDLRPGATDPVLDAVKCYGEIIKRIKAKDPTAKLIILGLAGEWGGQEDKGRQFIREWKGYWQAKDASVADLPSLIKGWHFHTYYYGLDRREICPSDDSRARNYKNWLDDELQLVYGRGVENEEIWVTEMGALIRNPTEEEKQRIAKLMECLVDVYETSSVVNRYAWFYHGCNRNLDRFCNQGWNSVSLFLPLGSGYAITELGQKYAALAYSSGGKPTATPPPSSCQGFGQPIVDQKQENHSGFNVLNKHWGYGGPLIFQPRIMGRLDKIALYLSGSGKIEAKVIDDRGEIIGEVVRKDFSKEGWLEFDFQAEGMVIPGNSYTISFRDPYDSGTVRFHRASSWAWAFRQYVRPCQEGGSTPPPSPTNTFSPGVPTITATPTPTGTLSGECSSLGQLFLEQERYQPWYGSNTIETSWGFGGPLIITAQNWGKVGKIALYAEKADPNRYALLQAKIIDSQGNGLTEVISRSLSGKGWYEFDFSNEPLFSQGEEYQIIFRAAQEDTVKLYRGSSWAWAYRVWIKPCEGGGLPPTVTPALQGPTPTLTPTPTPMPVSGNQAPVITTGKYSFPRGYINIPYTATLVEGYDEDEGDNLSLRALGLPPGLSLSSCQQWISEGKRKIKCWISGTPSEGIAARNYYGQFRLWDGQVQTISEFMIPISN